MFIEAIDKLRCTQEHEDSWLVAKFVEMRDRDFWEGELGCPVCEARYPVKDGIVYFSPISSKVQSGTPETHSPDELTALAAMLDLSAVERTVVLCGQWAAFAPALSEVSQPHLFMLNGSNPGMPVERIYTLVSEGVIPLATSSVDAIALDAGSTPELLKSALKVLREGGRLIGRTGVRVPVEVLLLASDDNNWVAQKKSEFIPLRRGSR
ncbi:MAG: hypothetical protein H0W69_04275 [Gemmatimonadaceae bacterium]|nr:hypothetical protein [Gemmatimonadaceae bacterium]